MDDLAQPDHLAGLATQCGGCTQAEILPTIARVHVGGGDAKNAPPELVAVLGDVRLRCPGSAGHPAVSPDGRYVVASLSDGTLCLLRLAAPGHVPQLPIRRRGKAPQQP